MGDYNRERSSGRSGGGSSYGGGFGGGNRRNSGGGRDGGRPELFRTTCDECSSSCEVPFKPSGDKPVYCSDCFRNVENSRNDRDSWRNEYSRGDRDNRGRRDEYQEKRMYEATCADCGNDCEVPFKPTWERPVFCSDCFITDDKSKSKKTDESKLEFENLNAKLDLIIKFLKIPEIKIDELKEVLLDEIKAPVKEKAVKKVTKKAV